MPRTLTLGNGNILVAIDKYAQVRDFYFPHVGLENHVGGHFAHRIGVWVDGKISWTSEKDWDVHIECEDEALAGKTFAQNPSLGVELSLLDTVYNEKNIFLRKVILRNAGDTNREFKLFFGQEFELYESHRGGTGYFDPLTHSIIHYSGKRVFLINGKLEGKGFDDYTTGEFNERGKEGSYKDADDGILSKNPIEHGKVDSAIGFTVRLEANEEATIYYWIVVTKSIGEAHELNSYILDKSPEHLIRTTRDYWHAWVNKESFNFHTLDKRIVQLFKKSLFIVRAHSDNHGAVIASADSDMLQGGKDTYSYMWPRDAAFAALALDMAGDNYASRRVFEFCNKALAPGGYFMHKYLPDGSLGSSWHPWVRDGKVELPIQEDETALIIYGLWKHYEISHDLEFIETIYNSLIKKAADFMVTFRDQYTGLPRPTYDLWEEKFGISTFTSSSVYAALKAAANFAELLGKKRSASEYRKAAEDIKTSILEHLYDVDAKMFYKMIAVKNGEIIPDKTFDMSSFYAIFTFGILDVDDERLSGIALKIEGSLSCKTLVGGIARYENDQYYRIDNKIPGNPWIITTLWLAQYTIANAKDMTDMTIAREWLNWVVDRALSSGVLSEQLNAYTGEQISASPLTWSHAEFVITVIKYLDKLEDLGFCGKDGCDPLYQQKPKISNLA